MKRSLAVLEGNYFGEKPKLDVKKAYCDRFCDVCKNPQQTALSKKALDPPEIVATQIPAIQKGAEDEFSDNEERTRSNTGESRSFNVSATSEELGKLPGFAKASDLKRKRSIESDCRGDTERAFPSKEAQNDLEGDESCLQIDSTRPSAVEEFQEEIGGESEELIWKPMRRPSKLAITEEAKEPKDRPPIPASPELHIRNISPSSVRIRSPLKDSCGPPPPENFFDDDLELSVVKLSSRATSLGKPASVRPFAEPSRSFSWWSRLII